MYHPNALLTVAHTREADLVREARSSGLGRAAESGQAPARPLARRLFALAPAAAVVVAALAWLIR
jgi:hypothetical protein